MSRKAVWALLLLAVPLSGCLEPDLVGKPAPPFHLTLSDGSAINESSYAGRYVILDLMATWCLPCRLEVAHLREVQAVYGDRVAIISIGADPTETNAQLDAFAEKYGATWPHGIDRDGRIGRAYGLNIIPKLVILDPEGKVVFVREGEVLPGAIARVIDPTAPTLGGTGAATAFAVSLLAAVVAFLGAYNPYRGLHRSGAPAWTEWAALAAFAAISLAVWRYGGLVSSRATYGSILVGALAVGAVLWWPRAKRKERDARPARAAVAVVDRMYESGAHYAFVVVLALSSTSLGGFLGPVVGFLVGAAGGLVARESIPQEARATAGLAGLAIAGVGLLVFGARVLIA